MSRKGMPKKGKGTPSETADTSTVDDTGTPEIFGGVEEHTIGKDEVPIVLTRTDPNFETGRNWPKSSGSRRRTTSFLSRGEMPRRAPIVRRKAQRPKKRWKQSLKKVKRTKEMQKKMRRRQRAKS